MNRRFMGFNNMADAQNWYVNHILSTDNLKSDRIINSTKLSDLIYSSYAFDDLFYNNDSREQPVNADALCKDLFSALYSPVMNRREKEELNVRERFFNNSVFNMVIKDKCFRELKKLCEDKEYVAYETAYAFTNALQELLDQKPWKPDKNYLVIIEMLNKQVNKTANDLKQGNLSPKLRLKMINSIFAKQSQIKELEKKLKEQAICYINDIYHDVDKALKVAVSQANQTHSIIQAWCEDLKEPKQAMLNRDLVEHVKNSTKLLEIAKILGKYKEIIADKRKNGFAYGLGEKYDITYGNDVNSCLSSEMALLGTPETEVLFMRKYEQRRLMQYRKRIPIVKGKGDIIVLLDESQSTIPVANWAKAFALAMLEIAAKDKRKFALVHFSSKDEIKTDIFIPGEYFVEDMMAAAEHFFCGCTDFETPLNEAVRLINDGFENADITIITDGECSLSKEYCEEFKQKLLSSKATMTGILLDKSNPCGKVLEQFCEKIYHSKEITEDEIAIDILNRKAA